MIGVSGADVDTGAAFRVAGTRGSPGILIDAGDSMVRIHGFSGLVVWSPINQVKMRPRHGRRGEREENLYLK